MMQMVFIVRLDKPWHPISRVNAEIVQGKKFTWAKTQDHRHLLGGSAFFVLAGAQRRKLHCLRQMVQSGGCRGKAPYAWDAANDALRRYAKTGAL